jgi:hypothetical protein
MRLSASSSDRGHSTGIEAPFAASPLLGSYDHFGLCRSRRPNRCQALLIVAFAKLLRSLLDEILDLFFAFPAAASSEPIQRAILLSTISVSATFRSLR